MSTVSFSLQRRPGSSPFKSPTAYQLRALVLDYLSHKCYTNTARAFINDSTVKALDADGDEIISGAVPQKQLSGPSASTTSSGFSGNSPISEAPPHVLLKQVQQRREIRESILAGRVETAIELLNAYFPSVLSDTLPHRTHDPSPPSSGTPAAQSSQTQVASTSFTYVSATSMEPAHLLLNLRILAFIELCRTRPLEIPASSSGSPVIRKSGAATVAPVGTAADSTPGESMDTSEEDKGVEESESLGPITPERLVGLLHAGKKLYALANALPNAKERELYKKELENVGGLMAYKVPEDSPVKRYLSYERREALADQINRATLYRSGLSPISTIEVLARYTTVVWEAARAHGVKARSGACLPPRSGRTPTPPTTIRPEDIVNEDVPAFDLRLFLDAKP